MKKLEKKILKKVYLFESRLTILKIIFRTAALVSFLSAIILLLGNIYENLYRQKTLAVLEIFFEDFEIIRENIGEVVETFLYEAPIAEIFFALFFLILFITIILNILLNYKRIKNKLIWLIKYLTGK